MYRVYGLRLDPNFGVRAATDKNLYLSLTVEKIYAFAVFTKKYLQPYGYSDINFTAVVNRTSSKTEMQTKIIEVQIILIQL